MGRNLRIIQWRKRRKLTQQDLADKCETTQQTIAKIEQGQVDPRLSTLEKVAEALECDLTELFYTRQGFLDDVNSVVKKLDLDLSKVRGVDLNNLCWAEAQIPPFLPFWSDYKIKNNKLI